MNTEIAGFVASFLITLLLAFPLGRYIARVFAGEKTFTDFKVGDTRQGKVNIRIIAATNRNLRQDIMEGRFREDLFYRLNLFTIQLPPLRERQADIVLLAEFFLRRLTRDANQHVKRMSHGYLEHLQTHDWRGNIRELKNVMEGSLILCRGNELTIDNLPVELQYTTLKSRSLSAFDLARVENMHIQRVLQYTKGNKAQAAKLLKIGIATLYRKLDEQPKPGMK
jgi:two-component system NtrC family response regulator